jgi:ABC-type transport system involved in cytochrome bd biosynthesis fused ATPase/permease subunit
VKLLREIPGLRRQAVLATALACVIAAAVAVQAVGLGEAVGAVLDGAAWHAWAMVFAAAVAVRAGLGWVAETSGRRAGAATMSDLRARLAAGAGPARAGELAAIAVTGGAAVERWAGRVLIEGALALTVPVAALLVIALRDPLSAALLAPALPLLVVFLVLAGGDAARVARERAAALALLGAHLLDVLRGLPVLRSFGRAGLQAAQLELAGEAYRRTTVATLRSAFVSSFALEFVAMLGTALVAVVAGVRLVAGTMAFDDALVVLVLAGELFVPLRRMGAEYHAAADARAALERLSAAEVQPVPAGTPGGPVPGLAALALEDVTVRAGGRTILDGLSLELPAGEVTAVIGPSGAGKSTLLRVLLGLQPYTGSVTCGGVPLDALDLDAWRARIAWMPQHPVVLPATLAANLRLAAPAARDEELWAALEVAGLEPWARRHGLAARIGDGGIAPSAGERRRLALARIALRDPALVLVDEPTANLDAATAALVADALATLLAGRTAVLVTHDHDLLRLADGTVELGQPLTVMA